MAPCAQEPQPLLVLDAAMEPAPAAAAATTSYQLPDEPCHDGKHLLQPPLPKGAGVTLGHVAGQCSVGVSQSRQAQTATAAAAPAPAAEGMRGRQNSPQPAGQLSRHSPDWQVDVVALPQGLQQGMPHAAATTSTTRGIRLHDCPSCSSGGSCQCQRAAHYWRRCRCPGKQAAPAATGRGGFDQQVC